MKKTYQGNSKLTIQYTAMLKYDNKREAINSLLYLYRIAHSQIAFEYFIR